jgi:hypothetical protein
MTVSSDLYRSWRSEGSYFSDMLDCGDRYNRWVEIALEHVPPNILDEYKERLVYVSTADRDGCRLARKYCEEREVILVSERILPKKGVSLGDPDVRYFVFVILHETVHAIKRHQSPKFDSLSESDNIAQENEADALALEWFNSYVAAQKNPYMQRLTMEEVKDAQARSRERMNDLYNGV